MRRFVTLLIAALALYLVFRVGQFGWSFYQAEQWSRWLWQHVQRGPGTVVDLGQIGPSEWERVYIFGPYTPIEAIEKALGFRWPDAKWTSIESYDNLNLLVFVKGGEAVGWFEHPRSRGDFMDELNTAGYPRKDAHFVISSDGRWWYLSFHKMR